MIDERALLSVCLVFHISLFVRHCTHHPPFSITLVVLLLAIVRFQGIFFFQSKVKRDRATSSLSVAPPTACYLASLYAQVHFSTTRLRRYHWKSVICSSHLEYIVKHTSSQMNTGRGSNAGYIHTYIHQRIFGPNKQPQKTNVR